MEIDLLSWAQMIQSARIQELARTPILWVVAKVFHKQARSLAHFFFDDKSGFRDAFGYQLRGAEELRQHAAQAPAVVQFPRPWHLQIRLHPVARDVDRPGRERHAEH